MTKFVSMTHVVRSQFEPCLSLAWFILEALEREHLMNLHAMSGTPGAFVDAWLRTAVSGTAPCEPGPRSGNPRREDDSALPRRSRT